MVSVPCHVVKDTLDIQQGILLMDEIFCELQKLTLLEMSVNLDAAVTSSVDLVHVC